MTNKNSHDTVIPVNLDPRHQIIPHEYSNHHSQSEHKTWQMTVLLNPWYPMISIGTVLWFLCHHGTSSTATFAISSSPSSKYSPIWKCYLCGTIIVKYHHDSWSKVHWYSCRVLGGCFKSSWVKGWELIVIVQIIIVVMVRAAFSCLCWLVIMISTRYHQSGLCCGCVQVSRQDVQKKLKFFSVAQK